VDRNTRQTRRAEARRRQTQPVVTAGNRWQLIVGAAIVLAALGLVVFRLFGSSGGSSSTPAALTQKIDGIRCESEMGTFHTHAHLTILDKGKLIAVPAQIGIQSNGTSGCMYWLHTHDESGIIHDEAPTKFVPRLRNFFHVWQQPISRTLVATEVVSPGQQMRVWVNQKPYSGDPGQIILREHTDITIEIGPPFTPPSKFDAWPS